MPPLKSISGSNFQRLLVERLQQLAGMTDHSGITPYDPYRGAADLGRLWVLKKGKQELSLYLHTHPLPGWELRLYIDAELRESKTVRTQDAIFDTSDAWKQKAEREGWTDK